MIPEGRILTINSGSSSLKLALYEVSGQEKLVWEASVNRIGSGNGRIQIAGFEVQAGKPMEAACRSQKEALDKLLRLIEQRGLGEHLHAISHRVVHGGPHFSAPQRVTPELIQAVRELVPLDPDHLPQALEAIGATARRYRKVPQVACFDTAFHRTMPRVAQLCPLPERYFEEGILRYGFHGISYEYIVSELRVLEPRLAAGRLVVAHLGNGASLCAIQGGRSVDTTMGFPPASGLLMGTRAGDIDSGVLLHLLAQKNATVKKLNEMINQQSGLLGISGLSEDMQDLLAAEQSNSRAADAVALFCYRARKYLAAYAGVLGGLDALVFTAGIGEHAPAIRKRICSGLDFIGIQLDPHRNRRNAPVISSDHSRVRVRVMKTNENLMLARHAWGVLHKSGEAERNCQHA